MLKTCSNFNFIYIVSIEISFFSVSSLKFYRIATLDSEDLQLHILISFCSFAEKTFFCTFSVLLHKFSLKNIW